MTLLTLAGAATAMAVAAPFVLPAVLTGSGGQSSVAGRIAPLDALSGSKTWLNGSRSAPPTCAARWWS